MNRTNTNARLTGGGRQILDKCLKERKPFSTSTGSLWAVTSPNGMTGDLNPTERNRYLEDIRSAGVVYLVLSYKTPIAWVTEDGAVHHAEQWFSQTTKRHQKIVRDAI